jgi:signal transduction histidine kinase
MRAPLGAITHVVDSILNKQGVSRKVVKLLKPVRYASKILSMQVFNLLDYNLLQKDKFRVNPQLVDIQEMIEQLVECMTPQASMRRVKIFVDVAREVPRPLLLDPDRFNQVLQNLITNAIKFTSNGKIVIRCSGIPFINPTSLLVEVEDTGSGIPRDKIGGLF